MYLARIQRRGITRYVIRQSYVDGGCLKSRDLFDLGSDPNRHIIYVGGNGYYYDDELQDALADNGSVVDQGELDRLFFDFLKPSIQRVIQGFDRSRRRTSPRALTAEGEPSAALHLFDKRRYHYLRFGHSEQRQVHRMGEKVFRPLHAKSRDELEQYFLAEERYLKPHQRPLYVYIIFELRRFTPDQNPQRPLIEQIDAFFISRLCRLNADPRFWEGLPRPEGLHDYLAKYAVMYFDFDAPRQSPWQAYVEDFINRHRTYHPPRKVQIKIEEAGRLFGLPWKELKQLDRRSLSRLYRKLALSYHPDQGGDPDLFRRLTQYYQVLSKKRR